MNYRAMRKLIETIKQYSDKINDLLSCENVDNEQIEEEARAAFYVVADIKCIFYSLDEKRLKNNKHEVVHAHNVIKLILHKMPPLSCVKKMINNDALFHYVLYEIALRDLSHIANEKIKQLSAIRSEQQKPYGKKYG